MTDPETRIGAALALLGRDVQRVFGLCATCDEDYLADVARTKRFLECLTYDPVFRQAFGEDPERYGADLGIDPEALRPLWDETCDPRGWSAPRLRRFQAYRVERRLRTASAAGAADPGADPAFAAWRRRQRDHLLATLGADHLERVALHPFAFELQKGCSVGCWFCGVSADRLTEVWPYDAANAASWRQTLDVVRARTGSVPGQGFCYWASDPLDNPDYEAFAETFRDIFGGYPQMTTAIALRDPARTKRVLEAAFASRREVHRFSILTLRMLRDVHRCFTPRDLLFVELAPLYPDSGRRLAHAGRARRRASRATRPEGRELATIACVAGFLINMVDRHVRLVAPCRASEQWPDGFRVLGSGGFADAAELGPLLDRLIAGQMACSTPQSKG